MPAAGGKTMEWTLKEAAGYYKRQGAPGDQSALISLLKEIQAEKGGSIPLGMLEELAEIYAVKASFLHAVVKRIPSLRLSDTHLLELCSGPNCGRHTQLAKTAEELCRKYPGKAELKFTGCMRMCRKGPNLRWDGTVYHGATEELIRKLLEK